MDRVRIAIVGCGAISYVTFPGYLRHPRAEITALCDHVRERAEEAARRWGISPRIYTDYDQVLADSGIDAVELLTPTHMHPDQSIAALAAGKHVSTQKPIGPTVADADRVAAAAAGSAAMFRVTENFLYYPPLVRAKELIDSGAIGEMSSMRMRTFTGGDLAASEMTITEDALEWRRVPADNPGGLTYDSGWHKFATAVWLGGEAETVSAIITRTEDFMIESPTAVIWKHAGRDLVGILECVYAPGMQIRGRYYPVDDFFEFQGSEGSIWVTRCTGEMHDLPPVMLFRGTDSRSFNVPSDWVEGFNGAAAAFVDGIISGEQQMMDTAMSRATLQLTLAPYLASDSGAAVDPRTITE